MPLDEAMHLYKDVTAISRGQPTNAVIPELKKIEIPVKTREIHPKDSHIRVDLSGTEDSANVSIYTDGSKTENHTGASMFAVKISTEIHTETQRLNITCTAFQPELCGIIISILLIVYSELITFPCINLICYLCIYSELITFLCINWIWLISVL